MFSLIRDFNDDPYFSGQMEHMRRMESMMDGMMSPFGLFGGNQPAIQAPDSRVAAPHQSMLMPFGFGGSLFPSMDNMFSNFSQMGNNPNCHSFASSSVMTYTTDGTGRPQVYQASSSTRTAPGGVKETRHSVQDSRTGLQKMAIGHHLNERGHVLEKQKNRYTGDEEENEEFINLEDDDAEKFNQEWQQRASFSMRPTRSMLGYEEPVQRTRSPQQELLAITDGSNAEYSSKKKSGSKHKRRAPGGHKSSASHSRPSPYQ